VFAILFAFSVISSVRNVLVDAQAALGVPRTYLWVLREKHVVFVAFFHGMILLALAILHHANSCVGCAVALLVVLDNRCDRLCNWIGFLLWADFETAWG
jgi:hypothetical protein